jgi:hydrogenase maturation protease
MIVLVVGIGQTFRSDDGAGIAAVAQWQEAYPKTSQDPSIRIEFAEVTGLGILDGLVGAQAAILVDAVRSGIQPPGSIHLLKEVELDAFGKGSASAHGLGIAETLILGRRVYLDRMPQIVILIGIEAAELGMGEGLSPMVRAAIPAAADLIEKQVRALLNREIRE